MIGTKQIVTLAFLVVGAGAVWVPQLLPDEEDAEAPRQSVPADAGAVAVVVEAPPAGPVGGPAEPDPGTRSATRGAGARRARPTEPRAPDDVAPSVESAEEPTTTARASEPDDGVDELLAALRNFGTGGAALQRGPWSAPQDGLAPEAPRATSVEASSERLAISTWLANARLRGTLVGEGGAVAVIDSRRVRPGDTLLGGALRVVEIGAEAVVLASGDERFELSMPAFTAADRAPTPSTTSGHGEPQPAPETDR